MRTAKEKERLGRHYNPEVYLYWSIGVARGETALWVLGRHRMREKRRAGPVPSSRETEKVNWAF